MVHCPASASRTKLEARGGGEGVEDLLGAVVDHGPGVEVVVGQGDVGDLDVVAGVDVDAVGVVARNGAPRRGQEDDQVAHAHRIGRVEAAQDVPHRVARGVEQARGQPGQVLQGDRLPPWGELDIDCVTHCSSHPLRARVAGPAGPGRRQGACGPRAPGPAPAVSPVRPPAWRRGGRASRGLRLVSGLSVAPQWPTAVGTVSAKARRPGSLSGGAPGPAQWAGETHAPPSAGEHCRDRLIEVPGPECTASRNVGVLDRLPAQSVGGRTGAAAARLERLREKLIVIRVVACGAVVGVSVAGRRHHMRCTIGNEVCGLCNETEFWSGLNKIVVWRRDWETLRGLSSGRRGGLEGWRLG